LEKEKIKILKKLSEQGIIVNGITLVGLNVISSEKKIIPLFICSSLFLLSCYCLKKVKSPYVYIKKESNKSKIKKR